MALSQKRGKIHLLITTKESALPRALEYNLLRKTPVFKKKYIISTDSFSLSDGEKIDIFDKQLDYAEKILGIPKPLVDEEFKREMRSSECHVGFPLCAHLYASEKGYLQAGVGFFRYPINYLRRQIKYEIDTDTTHSVKTLLLLLFLQDCLSLSEGYEERLDLRDSEKCKQFVLQGCSKEMVDQIEPLFSGDLEKGC